MDLRALVALAISLNTTNACPLIFNVFMATMSKIGPNWINMAYRFFFNSTKLDEINLRNSVNRKYLLS